MYLSRGCFAQGPKTRLSARLLPFFPSFFSSSPSSFLLESSVIYTILPSGLLRFL